MNETMFTIFGVLLLAIYVQIGIKKLLRTVRGLLGMGVLIGLGGIIAGLILKEYMACGIGAFVFLCCNTMLGLLSPRSKK